MEFSQGFVDAYAQVYRKSMTATPENVDRVQIAIVEAMSDKYALAENALIVHAKSYLERKILWQPEAALMALDVLLADHFEENNVARLARAKIHTEAALCAYAIAKDSSVDDVRSALDLATAELTGPDPDILVQRIRTNYVAAGIFSRSDDSTKLHRADDYLTAASNDIERLQRSLERPQLPSTGRADYWNVHMIGAQVAARLWKTMPDNADLRSRALEHVAEAVKQMWDWQGEEADPKAYERYEALTPFYAAEVMVTLGEASHAVDQFAALFIMRHGPINAYRDNEDIRKRADGVTRGIAPFLRADRLRLNAYRRDVFDLPALEFPVIE
ncbi:MAG: hypothetical protein ABIH41_07455 [Nanoarchaeota archaeon]